MTSHFSQRVCLVPRLAGVGGMVSFQHKLAAGLKQAGIAVTYSLNDDPYDAVLVIGGTRALSGLLRARRKGVPVVQRLDGMNWLHRLARPGLRPASIRHFLRAEYGNWLLALIRSRLASRIVYQSEFSRAWWERARGPAPVPCRVIYNGVDLNVYSPQGPETPLRDRVRVLMVEGSLMGGYEQGLGAAVDLCKRLAHPPLSGGLPVELMVVGRVPPVLQAEWDRHAAATPGFSIAWAGLVPQERIPAIDRAAHLLYSADINPACPNSVVEALACGLPVVAYDTGALPEMVSAEAGRIVPYGGDPWRLDPPDASALAVAAQHVLEDQPRFRRGARAQAESLFSLESMVDHYLDVLYS